MSKAKKFQDLEEYEQLVEKSAASSDGTRSDKEQIDLFSADIVIDPTALPRMANPQKLQGSFEDQARAYLDANCAHCHQPGGWASESTGLDLRYEPVGKVFRAWLPVIPRVPACCSASFSTTNFECPRSTAQLSTRSALSRWRTGSSGSKPVHRPQALGEHATAGAMTRYDPTTREVDATDLSQAV